METQLLLTSLLTVAKALIVSVQILPNKPNLGINFPNKNATAIEFLFVVSVQTGGAENK